MKLILENDNNSNSFKDIYERIKNSLKINPDLRASILYEDEIRIYSQNKPISSIKMVESDNRDYFIIDTYLGDTYIANEEKVISKLLEALEELNYI